MRQETVCNLTPFLKETDNKRREQFTEYFHDAPWWLLKEFRIEKIEKDTLLVKEGEPADTIYYVIKGVVEAADYRVYGVPFNYMRFDKLYAFGGMEFMTDEDVYRTNLWTVTDCVVVKLSRTVFGKWMYSDIHAMKYEAKQICEYLLAEGRNNRLFLFMQGADRLALFLVDHYKKYHKDGWLEISAGRQSLADETGLCLRSINRSIKKFYEEGLITKKGQKILISKEQYEELRKIVEKKIDLS